MESFAGTLAVVTGGGTGMGRELVRQLTASGADVATCDINPSTLAETERLASSAAPPGTRVTTDVCDVSDESQVLAFRDAVLADHETDHVDLVFNNAAIGGGGSFLAGRREEWDRVFSIAWGGVYYCTRAFLPLLVAAPEGVLINTSSVNGFWATLGPGMPNTAYSTAKFAVKGFTEALMVDLEANAPHVRAVVVMPGHVGTDIVLNSRRVLSGSDEVTTAELADARRAMRRFGVPVDAMDDEAVRRVVREIGEGFRDKAPLTAAQAAAIILDGVLAGQWRILVGEDAKRLDAAVRADPENAYKIPGPSLPTSE